MNCISTFQNQLIDPLLLSINQLSNNNAFCINEVFYTYKEFGYYIYKIREAVKGIKKSNIYIGLVVNDDIETYASILSLWLEGKAYIPLHPNHPLQRCNDMIKQMNIKTILDSSETSRFQNHSLISTYKLLYKNDFYFINNIENDFTNDAVAYVLFTSGSTGSPKGVTISYSNIAAFLDSFWACGIKINEKDKCLQCFDLTFDVSIQSFLAPLIKGACVYTIPHDKIKYSYVYSLLTDHHLTFGAMAPSMLRYLRPYFDEICAPSMKTCILTAEASPIDLVLEWQRCISNAEIYNFYGPTEATIYCTFYKIDRNEVNKSLNGMLSIGKPMKNVNAIIIDENKNILSEGEKGELCVSGNQISPGYWNSPEKNEKAFFEKYYNGIDLRFYRTGDLCYLDNEGNLMLVGRLDSQIKIQGYRVELSEIEFHSREYLAGNNAVALSFVNGSGITEIALFIESETISTQSLLAYLRTKMPAYMIPTKVMFEPRFPLNSNSKVDKLFLKEKIK
jgi:D-alanine--poly(phosphoribitol) ligase subunit 1